MTRRPETDRGSAVARVKPAKRIERSGRLEGPRTVTVDRLKNDLSLAAQTIERHDQAINEWLAPLARALPAQLANLGAAIGKLDGTVSGFAQLSADIRKELADHDQRLGVVEDRAAGHESRLDLFDEIPPRVAALEERKRAETVERAVTEAVVAQQRAWIGFAVRHGWKVLSAVLAALAGYYGLIK